MTDRAHPSRPRRLLTRVTTALAAAIMTVGLGTATASAILPAPGGGSCSHNCWANYVEFVDGPNSNYLYWYKYVKGNTSLHRHYDWGFNGCSVPSWAIKTLGGVKWHFIDPHLDEKATMYAKFFGRSCRLHDFGYRNFGGSPYHVTMGDSSDGRKSVDDRLLQNMHRQCNNNAPAISYVPDKWACNRVAGVFYQAVRKFAGSHWG